VKVQDLEVPLIATTKWSMRSESATVL
jgi:hypothetical protein